VLIFSSNPVVPSIIDRFGQKSAHQDFGDLLILCRSQKLKFLIQLLGDIYVNYKADVNKLILFNVTEVVLKYLYVDEQV
jgi:hypothetical protein